MSAEYMAEKVMDALADTGVDDLDNWAEENVRTGGFFFDLTHKGRHYQIEVTEVTGR